MGTDNDINFLYPDQARKLPLRPSSSQVKHKSRHPSPLIYTSSPQSHPRNQNGSQRISSHRQGTTATPLLLPGYQVQWDGLLLWIDWDGSRVYEACGRWCGEED